MNKLMIRVFFRWGASILPQTVTKIACGLFFTSQKIGLNGEQASIMASANQSYEVVNGNNIAVYGWGDAERKALLVHGWSSRAGRLARFVQPLLDNHYQVVAVDLPAHGNSDGKSTDIREICQVLLKLQERYGEFELLIAHSFGATCAAYSVNNGLKTKVLAAVSMPGDFEKLVYKYQELIGLPEHQSARLIENIKAHFGLDKEQSIQYFSAVPNLMKCGVPIVVVHDKHDKIVPFQEGLELSKIIPGADFLQTENLGHTRILSDEPTVHGIVNKVLKHGSFINDLVKS